MKFIVMCHRPRTQRLGKDSMPREIEIKCCQSMQEAVQVQDVLIMVHRKMADAGYPWPGGKVYDFQTQPNDNFYIKLGEMVKGGKVVLTLEEME